MNGFDCEARARAGISPTLDSNPIDRWVAVAMQRAVARCSLLNLFLIEVTVGSVTKAILREHQLVQQSIVKGPGRSLKVPQACQAPGCLNGPFTMVQR